MSEKNKYFNEDGLKTENNLLNEFNEVLDIKPVPVAARSKAYVFGRSPAENVGSNPTGGMDVCLL